MAKKSKKVGKRLREAARLRKNERFQKMNSQRRQANREASDVMKGCFISVALLVLLACIFITIFKLFG